jgi:hypothetical protein
MMGIRTIKYSDEQIIEFLRHTKAGMPIKKIVCLSMALGMPTMLLCAALQMAFAQRNLWPGLTVHADRIRNTPVTWTKHCRRI